MSALIRLGVVRAFGRSLRQNTSLRRNINTSSKKKSVSSEEVSPNENKNWITYGFSEIDPFIDRLSMHVTAFVAISFVMVFGGFFLAHVPDPKYHEWSQREAYLELRRRESLGLPLIDPNYVDPSKVVLPTDDELGDTDIII